jgi:archaellin
MSEIPMPEPGGYEAVTTEKKKGCCSRTVVLCIVVIAVVVIGVIAATVLLGGPSYQTRVVDEYYNEDVNLSTTTFYRGEFYVSSSETQTSTQPDLYFQITVDTGSDSMSVTVHIAVYNLDVATFDSIETWAEVDNYLMDEKDIAPPVDDYIDLYNFADTYTWVIWFEASEKTDTWNVDITLTLRYNWSQ